MGAVAAYVIIPGIDGSDEGHWQTLWEAGWGTSAVRIRPASWTAPDLADWVAAVQAAYGTVREAADTKGRGAGTVLLVAHSLGCWAAAAWLERARPEGVAAFLVAPPDPRGPAFPREAAASFLDVTARPLPCPGLVVAGDDDPYGDPRSAAAFADGWGVPLRLLAGHGHINSAAGLDAWPGGRALLATLTTEHGAAGAH